MTMFDNSEFAAQRLCRGSKGKAVRQNCKYFPDAFRIFPKIRQILCLQILQTKELKL